MASVGEPKITFYTNHRCPWAHRAQIALSALGLPYTESIVDLDTPRTAEYLKVNPRGLIPSLEYDGAIVTESAIVAQFLADAHPGKLAPPSEAPGAALVRARMAFFADTYMSKVNGPYNKALRAASAQEAEGFVADLVAAVKHDVEPLLVGAKPYFGGAESLTMAEALTAPFVLRMFTFAKAGMLPASLATTLEAETPKFHAWAQAIAADKAVTGLFPEEEVVIKGKEMVAKAKA